MKILMLPGYRYPGSLDEALTCGDLRYSFTLSRALARRGATVTVLSRGTDADAADAVFDGVRVLRYRSELASVFATSFDISRNRSRLFHATAPAADAVILNSPLSLELRSSVAAPMIYVCSGLEDIRNYRWSLGETVQRVGIRALRDPSKRASWRRSRWVNTTAAQEAETLVRMGVPPHKVRTIGPSVERQRYAPQRGAAIEQLRQALHIDPETRVILSVSRFTPAKGLLETVEAFAGLRSQSPTPVVLLLVGVQHSHRGDYRQQVMRRIAELRVADAVRWSANVPERDLPLYYSLADVTSVFSVGYDPLPTVLLESQACGTPVVSTRMPTRRQVVEHGVSGLEVEEANVADWIAAVQGLLTNPELAGHLRHYALRSIEATADADAVATQYLQLFEAE